MGSCQAQGLQCHCTQQRISCECQISSERHDQNNSTGIAQPSQNNKRTNRFAQDISKKNSQRESKDSGERETIKQTKSLKTLEIHNQSSEKYQQCNVRTETETNWVPVRQKVKRRIIVIKQMGIYFRETTEEDINFDIFDDNILFDDNKLFSDLLEDSKSDNQTLIFESPLIINSRQKSIQSNIAYTSLTNQKRSSQILVQIALDSRSLPVALQSLSPERLDQANSHKAASLNTYQNELDTRNYILQFNQKILADSVESIKSFTPSKSALKSRSKDEISFRTHKATGSKKHVKFNLPQSYYINEKNKTQQKFF